MAYFADLHIHSCLSPCGDDDMTPANIAGMAKIKGLDIIAVTDHNAARNLPAVQKCCEAYGLLLLPGMEITTKEEVHLLGYFDSVDTALRFGKELKNHLPKKKNKSREDVLSKSRKVSLHKGGCLPLEMTFLCVSLNKTLDQIESVILKSRTLLVD